MNLLHSPAHRIAYISRPQRYHLLANSLYWLKAARVAEPAIIVTIDTTAGTITVEDNGPGVDPDLAGLIFTPFMSTKRGGRGLGLFIVRELLTLEGTTISLLNDRNAQGRLYRFQIDLHNLVH